jgi:Ca2+-binding EF-hand superfamily protein
MEDVVLEIMLALLAAQALPGSTPPPPVIAPPALAVYPSAAPKSGLQQIFIAPSGEIFRAAAEAAYPVTNWFARADTDHDGKLTEAEFVADVVHYFTVLDLDHDGVIDGRELSRYEEALAPELHTSSYDGDWGAKHDDDDGSGAPRPRNSLGSFMDKDSPQGAGRFDLLRIPEPVASMDTNLNGRITRNEANDAGEYRFSVLDAHQRGYLTLADLPETYAQHHKIDDHRAGSSGKHGKRGGGGGRHGGGQMGGDHMGGGRMSGGDFGGSSPTE